MSNKENYIGTQQKILAVVSAYREIASADNGDWTLYAIEFAEPVSVETEREEAFEHEGETFYKKINEELEFFEAKIFENKFTRKKWKIDDLIDSYYTYGFQPYLYNGEPEIEVKSVKKSSKKYSKTSANKKSSQYAELVKSVKKSSNTTNTRKCFAVMELDELMEAFNEGVKNNIDGVILGHIEKIMMRKQEMMQNRRCEMAKIKILRNIFLELSKMKSSPIESLQSKLKKETKKSKNPDFVEHPSEESDILGFMEDV